MNAHTIDLQKHISDRLVVLTCIVSIGQTFQFIQLLVHVKLLVSGGNLAELRIDIVFLELYDVKTRRKNVQNTFETAFFRSQEKEMLVLSSEGCFIIIWY